MATFFTPHVDNIHRVYARWFAGSTDTEHEQALIRLTIAVVAWCYVTGFVYGFPTHAFTHPLPWWVATLFVGVALSVVVAIIYGTGHPTLRRLFGNIVDVAIISYAIYTVEAYTLGLLSVYLWVILGNGFRYGLGYLWWTTALTIVGFSLAIFYSDGWYIPSIPWANAVLVLVALPLYCSGFIARLRRFVAQAQDTQQGQRLWMTSISHDMRTPLANMSGMIDLLHCTPMSAEQQDYFNRLAVATTTLKLLIADILDTNLMEKGRIRLKKHYFDPKLTVEKIAAIIAPQAREKNLRFTSEQTSLPVAVLGDECRLMQILMNMLSNALHYTREGRIELHVQATHDHPHGCELVFTVVDTGIGMSHQFLKTFTQTFKREQRCQNTEGHGLGASITLQLIELMGGQMYVHSEVDQGTRIVIHIPFEYPEAHEQNTADTGLHDMRALLISQEGHHLNAHLQQWGLCVDQVQDDLAYYARPACEPHRYEVIIAERSALTQGVTAFTAHRHQHALSVPMIVLEQSDADFRSTAVMDSVVSAHIARYDIPALCHALIDIRSQRRRVPSPHLQVFVAEDNETFGLYLRTVLEKLGCTVTVAENGYQAIQRLSQRIEYDAYFLDMCLPGHNGVEIFEFLRHHHPGNPKVIALTAAANDEMRQRCQSLGFTQFLGKPVTMQQLIMALSHHALHTTADHNTPERSVTDLLDRERLEQCRALGSHFLHELIASFKQESGTLLTHIEHTDCLSTFSQQVHSLKNCAASIGAHHMAQIANAAMYATDAEMASYRRQLLDVAQATDEALQQYLAHTNERPIPAASTGEPT